MTAIIDETGYCSVHKSYKCECYRPSVGKMNCPHGPCICSHCKEGCPRCTIDDLRADVASHELVIKSLNEGVNRCRARYEVAEKRNSRVHNYSFALRQEVERLKSTVGFNALLRNSRLEAHNKVLRDRIEGSMSDKMCASNNLSEAGVIDMLRRSAGEDRKALAATKGEG